MIIFLVSLSLFSEVVYAMAADCAVEPSTENYIGVRYKAFLVEDELSETGWLIIFAGSGFTKNSEYQPHFIDLMIKAGWADLYDDGLCAPGFPPVRQTLKTFTIQLGLSDYEDPLGIWDNDIAAWSENPDVFPRMFTNIDSTDPKAADKIMTELQVDKVGQLEGREIEVIFERGDVVRLPRDRNYYCDPDQSCKCNAQDDILYREWIATVKVPSLNFSSSVRFYINADQGDKITGFNTLNLMWENPGKPAFKSDRLKIIFYDLEVKTLSGEWRKAERFLVDYRTPYNELPLDEDKRLVGGYRKVNFMGKPAIEVSFGYGYTDYVQDKDPTDYEKSLETKGVIDLEHPLGSPSSSLVLRVLDQSKEPLPNISVGIDGNKAGLTDTNGEIIVRGLYPGYHIISLTGFNVTKELLVELPDNEPILD